MIRPNINGTKNPTASNVTIRQTSALPSTRALSRNKGQFDTSAAITIMPKSATATFDTTGSARDIAFGKVARNAIATPIGTTVNANMVIAVLVTLTGLATSVIKWLLTKATMNGTVMTLVRLITQSVIRIAQHLPLPIGQ